MSKKKATAISLPISRTAKIMNSAVGVESVNQDIVALATKATEIFLMDFARRAYDQSSEEEFMSNTLEYKDIQRLVHSDPRYNFLIDTIPKRIRYSDAIKLVEAANAETAAREVARATAKAAAASQTNPDQTPASKTSNTTPNHTQAASEDEARSCPEEEEEEDEGEQEGEHEEEEEEEEGHQQDEQEL